MFHPGRVFRIFMPNDKDVVAADPEIQATLRMWDGNVLTLDVSKKLGQKLKEGDIVLVDYRPKKVGSSVAPAHIVSRILRGARAETLLKEYEAFRDRVKEREESKRHVVSRDYIR